jgi:hypothetical protein
MSALVARGLVAALAHPCASYWRGNGFLIVAGSIESEKESDLADPGSLEKIVYDNN